MRCIGIVGVGLLGSAVASRLLQSGFEVTGYDTRPETMAALRPQGLRAAGSIADTAAGMDAVFTILPSLESVEAVIGGPGGLVESSPRETLLIQMSTISPDLTRRLHEMAMARGLGFLDAPISGTSAMVSRGDCTILVGGDPQHVQSCRPVFDAIAQRTVQVGTAGMASLAKLVTNLLVALNTAALAEALVLGGKGGLDFATMLDAMQGTAASSRMMEIRGPLMAADEFPAQMKLDLFLKDLRLMLEAGQNLGVPLPLTSTAQQLYTAAGNTGAGQLDLAVIIKSLEQMAGLTR
ncbi:MAG: NAD(P)-dependent oxidoreductase [Candidatus Tectomicrobia bacterium]